MHEDFAVKNKMSYQQKRVPHNLLPNINDGNYSLILNDKNVGQANEWIKRDLRTASGAINIVQDDL